MSGLTWNPRMSIDTIRKQRVEKIPSLSTQFHSRRSGKGNRDDTRCTHFKAEARSSIGNMYYGDADLEHEQRNETRVGNPWSLDLCL
jgi:hypothetical protein